jgi:hypothetical protein
MISVREEGFFPRPTEAQESKTSKSREIEEADRLVLNLQMPRRAGKEFF